MPHTKHIYLIYHNTPNQLSFQSNNKYSVPFPIFKRQMFLIKEKNIEKKYNYIIPTFDDGDITNLEAARFLNSMNLSAIFFVITDRVNQSGYLTDNNICEIYSLGHIIGSHSATHPAFPFLNKKKCEDELKKSKKYIEDLIHSECHSFAFPGGLFTPRDIRMAKHIGYKYIFTSMEGLTRNSEYIYRMHINQSNLSKFNNIISVNRFYYFIRKLRSYASLLKNIYVKKLFV